MEDRRHEFRHAIEKSTQSPIESGYFERSGKNPGQDIIRGFIISFTCPVHNSEHAKDNTQAMREYMANLHQLESDERQYVELPLLDQCISHGSPFEKDQNYPYGYIPLQRIQVFPVIENSAKNESSKGTFEFILDKYAMQSNSAEMYSCHSQDNVDSKSLCQSTLDLQQRAQVRQSDLQSVFGQMASGTCRNVDQSNSTKLNVDQ